MYYTVYKITNILNGKIYVGAHKTKNLDDDYFGSGVLIRRAIKKYGIKNFKKEILFIFDNEKDMFNKESELVNSDFISEDGSYNLNVGGFGGWTYINKNGLNIGVDYINENKLNNKNNQYKISSEKIKEDEEYKQWFSDRVKDGLLGCECRRFSGKRHSEETKKKMRKSAKERIKKFNPQKGKCWIYNENLKVNKSIEKKELETYLNEGWVKGRKMRY